MFISPVIDMEKQKRRSDGLWCMRFSGFNEMVVIHLKTVYNIKITINEQVRDFAQKKDTAKSSNDFDSFMKLAI